MIRRAWLLVSVAWAAFWLWAMPPQPTSDQWQLVAFTISAPFLLGFAIRWIVTGSLRRKPLNDAERFRGVTWRGGLQMGLFLGLLAAGAMAGFEWCINVVRGWQWTDEQSAIALAAGLSACWGGFKNLKGNNAERQAELDNLQRIYKMIENKEWDKVWARREDDPNTRRFEQESPRG